MPYLKSFNSVVFAVLRRVLIASVSVLVVGLFVQIVLRYLFSQSIDIIDEAGRYLFVWTMFLTISVGFREKSHMGVTFLLERLPPRGQKILGAVILMLVFVFFAAIVMAGKNMVGFTMTQLSSTMQIPMAYVYLAAPVGGILCLLVIVEEFVELLATPAGEASR